METNVQTTGKGLPDYKHLRFTLNPETGYYDMSQGELGFTKVPAELRLEATQRKGQIHSDYLIRSRQKDNRFPFFTGLLPTEFENMYFGDFYEIRKGIKKNSFILFLFTPDLSRFEMFFFNHFKLYPDRRKQFIRAFVAMLKKERG